MTQNASCAELKPHHSHGWTTQLDVSALYEPPGSMFVPGPTAFCPGIPELMPRVGDWRDHDPATVSAMATLALGGFTFEVIEES